MVFRQEKLFKFTVHLVRAPYEIGEEIRGRLLKILVIQRKKKRSIALHPLPILLIYSTIFSLHL